MVKLTQIDDESNAAFSQPEATTVPKTESYSDSESESDSDVEDDFDYENETIYDRIVALKDIIAPEQRVKISSFSESVKSYVNCGLNKSGTLLWALTSSALLLGVPLSLAILAETQLQEMENQLSLQPGAQDVLAAGAEAEKKPSA
ncbi:mitochondrial import translocase, subunit Tom22 [Suhomyces tanzawaensis NRRL Y-17324]|uniref:Mitochondrial import translocase, subunit Tom22 n=1 Tax=Suhomyces tanzawaensis NRRL Y-17324 TaxID=984487 RepID=A0A1E4SCF6_9ASCO|nr:mitochondrial import translocase, subunit Tom22 [Suhomyces tanzawaensis NRRL Y-17324]ODV77148.1 mitochondrial import translocase, subunit Tom22 [Suhomyces tanzawaensis NRRL Y-17324]